MIHKFEILALEKLQPTKVTSIIVIIVEKDTFLLIIDTVIVCLNECGEMWGNGEE